MRFTDVRAAIDFFSDGLRIPNFILFPLTIVKAGPAMADPAAVLLFA